MGCYTGDDGREAGATKWTQLEALLSGRVCAGKLPITINMHDHVIEFPASVLRCGGAAVSVPAVLEHIREFAWLSTRAEVMVWMGMWWVVG